MGLGESAENGFPPVRQQELWGAPAAVRGKPSATQTPRKKNAQPHKMNLLRISSFYARKMS